MHFNLDIIVKYNTFSIKVYSFFSTNTKVNEVLKLKLRNCFINFIVRDHPLNPQNLRAILFLV